MKNKEKKYKVKIPEEKKKSVLTSFILLFPSLLMATLITLQKSIVLSSLAVALFFYQSILIKNFLDDHYKTN